MEYHMASFSQNQNGKQLQEVADIFTKLNNHLDTVFDSKDVNVTDKVANGHSRGKTTF